MDKDGALPFGLGHVCDEACRNDAVSSRRKKLAKNNLVARDFSHPDTSPPKRKVSRNVPTPEQRKAIQLRDGGRCRFCQSSHDLHVHHIRYKSEGGTHEDTNLVTLCMRCHDIVHSRKHHWQPVLKELIRQQYYEDTFILVGQAERALYEDPPVVTYD